MQIFYNHKKYILGMIPIVIIASFIILAGSLQTRAAIRDVVMESDAMEEWEEEASPAGQINAFSVPFDNSGTEWKMQFNRRNDFRKVSFGFTTAPAPRTKAQFDEIWRRAQGTLGAVYTPAGTSIATGFDCSGLVWYLIHNQFLQLNSASTAGQYAQCYILEDYSVRPGDIVFFNDTGREGVISHVGLYIGDDQFIHATLSKGVIVSNVNEEPWSNSFVCYGRPYL